MYFAPIDLQRDQKMIFYLVYKVVMLQGTNNAMSVTPEIL